MTPDPLPPELSELEQRLRDRLLEGPAPAWRDRVLAELKEEINKLGRSEPAPAIRISPAPRMLEWWRYAAAIAAVLLIGLNLAGVAASVTPVFANSWEQHQKPALTADMVHELDPELPGDEVRRILWMSRTAEQLPRVPAPQNF